MLVIVTLLLVSASEDPFRSNLSGTSEKDGHNYLLWAHSFERFLLAHRKTQHITHPPRDVKDASVDEWLVMDAAVAMDVE
uniref:Retrotransposon Copia-like N-terminal domain-containing protein n=1 Tax=Utricularia reniformis TaxID=192314 RepID=A0A1Y0AZ58_9LAMI|nr:hypothetical protein AEK19_MT1950 [Utricularia reniformis]ART30420.1 hypothetical protein AEK19_MT1950 [Utricularia reniformis]